MIAVIGAGIAGLSCGACLASQGHTVVVFEKSRGLGGRLASRRTNDGMAFDHGAQFVTARGNGFKNFLQNELKTGGTAVWQPAGERDRSEKWYVGIPRMNGFVRSLSTDLDVRLKTEVFGLSQSGEGWVLRLKGGHESEVFDRVVVTAPTPQTRGLLSVDADMVSRMEGVRLAPCWALMVRFTGTLQLPFDVARSPSPDIGWVARNRSKPGRDPHQECWVVHASPAWTRDHLELDASAAADALLAAFAQAMVEFSGFSLPEPSYLAAHRWRFAMTEVPLGQPFLSNSDGTLVAAGDWCLGARVEYGYESGMAAARHVLAQPVR